MANQGKKSGGMRKYGRNKTKCDRYSAMHTREKNKISRVLQSCGLEYAKAYARDCNMLGYLNSLTAKRRVKVQTTSR